jgi:hypothetical protein
MRVSNTVLASLLIGSSLVQGAVYTKVFRLGIDAYTGCKSVDISDSNFKTTVGSFGDNGFTYGDGAVDWCTGLLHGDANYGYDISPLMRFENITGGNAIPVGATVIAANLTLRLMADATGIYKGYYLMKYWDASPIPTTTGAGWDANVGWRYSNKPDSWSSYGATGEGTDYVAGKSFSFPSDGSVLTHDGMGGKLYTSPLDVVEVQKWISDPSKNYGFKFQVDRINVHIAVTQCQRDLGSTSQRYEVDTPTLTIVFSSDQYTGGNNAGGSSGSSGTSGGSSGTSGTSGLSGTTESSANTTTAAPSTKAASTHFTTSLQIFTLMVFLVLL